MSDSEETIKTDISEVLNTLADVFDKELYALKEEELEDRWFFKYDSTLTLEKNLYQFYDLLELYSGFCRRWEEHHNGHVCVVERVRDKYIMPKINDLCEIIRDQLNEKL